jgi:quercetin dioxygenase-like cupin family protein
MNVFYPHTHGAQYGTFFKGEIELILGGKTRNYQKGDSYFVPSSLLHSAVFRQKTLKMGFFADNVKHLAK